MGLNLKEGNRLDPIRIIYFGEGPTIRVKCLVPQCKSPFIAGPIFDKELALSSAQSHLIYNHGGVGSAQITRSNQ